MPKHPQNSIAYIVIHPEDAKPMERSVMSVAESNTSWRYAEPGEI